MAERVFSPKCAHCRQRMVTLKAINYHTKFLHDGREYEVVVPGLVVPQCSKCHNYSLDDEANDQIDAAFRRMAGLLSPEEIRQKRESLGLNQQQFAERIGVAVSTLSRWENGIQIQQRVMNNLLRAFFDVPELREYLAPKKRQGGASTGLLQAATVEPAPAVNTTMEIFSTVLQPHGSRMALR